MCGFVAWLGTARAPANPRVLRDATRSLAHRGPDGEGIVLLGRDGATRTIDPHAPGAPDPALPLGFGHRRLAIIDVAAGQQPMLGPAGRTAITYNGELYNYRELRPELEADHAFATKSDSEVLLAACARWGGEALPRLNGIFGFAFWDGVRGELLAARDPFGVKPVYWCHLAGGGFGVASEIRALLALPRSEPPAVDTNALDQFLTFRYVPSPLTLLAGIRKLAPGHALIAGRSERPRLVRYAPPPPPIDRTRSRRTWVRDFAETFERAVTRQLVADPDVPVGVFLSGGLDSSAITAIMATRSATPIATFTVGFKGTDPVHDERAAARAVADRFNTEHHEIEIAAGDFLADLPRVIERLEEPNTTGPSMAQLALAELARPHVKVALAGQGADEPLGGYARYAGEQYRRWLAPLTHVPGAGIVARALGRGERFRRAATALGEPDLVRRLCRTYAVFDPAWRARLWPARPRPDGLMPRLALAPWLALLGGRSPLGQMLALESRTWLPDELLQYGDKMTMAAGLEMRVPFLDLELMRLVEAMPVAIKRRRLTGKWVLKRAARRWLPRSIIRRPKVGFAMPLARWFGGELYAPLRETFSAAGSFTRAHFELAPVLELLDRHRDGTWEDHRQILALYALEVWARHFLGAPA